MLSDTNGCVDGDSSDFISPSLARPQCTQNFPVQGSPQSHMNVRCVAGDGGTLPSSLADENESLVSNEVGNERNGDERRGEARPSSSPSNSVCDPHAEQYFVEHDVLHVGQ
jgi:hypothetical protein